MSDKLHDTNHNRYWRNTVLEGNLIVINFLLK